MKLHPMKLVTVICEALAREAVLQALTAAGAHGWTLATVEGSGRQGERVGDIPEFANLRIEVIVPPSVAESLLDQLEREFFPRYAMVAHETDIRVLRPAKF